MHQRIIILGRLGKQPELRTTPNGLNICKFSVAVSEKSKGAEHTEWFNCTAFSKTAELISRMNKGESIYLEGKLKTNEVQGNDGIKKRYTDLIVSEFAYVSGSKPVEQTNTIHNNANIKSSDITQNDIAQFNNSFKSKPFDMDDLPF